MGRIVGIDLGTTTSEIAYIKNGRPEVIKNGYSSSIPSVVGMDSNYNIIVGEKAKDQLLNAQDRTVAEIKRKMGTGETVVLAGKKFTPVSISAEILKELKKMAERYLEEEVTEAVITVPANFNYTQRQATKEAGEKAGFIVDRIINEPTAAALAFGVDNMTTEGKVLVYDIGGGTFDVTIFEMTKGFLDVKVSRGVNKLGGKDFDEKIISFILMYARTQYGLDIRNDLDVIERLNVLGRIKTEAEKAKIELSSSRLAYIDLPFLTERNGSYVNFEMELTRSRYEQMIMPYVKQSMDVVDKALKAAKMTADDIDIVIAVGGSSRTPLIIDELNKKFGHKIKRGVNPDEAVALGAAIQAGIYRNEISGSDTVKIFDVCNHTLGSSASNEDETKEVYNKIINRDSHLPFLKRESFSTVSDNQTEFNLKIYQGEHSDKSKNTILGEIKIDGIPPQPEGKEKVDVEYIYNLNGMVDVNISIPSTGKMVSKTINTFEYDAPKNEAEEIVDEIVNMSWDQASEIKTTIMLYFNRRERLPESARKKADSLIIELKKAITMNDGDKMQEIDDELTTLLFEYYY